MKNIFNWLVALWVVIPIFEIINSQCNKLLFINRDKLLQIPPSHKQNLFSVILYRASLFPLSRKTVCHATTPEYVIRMRRSRKHHAKEVKRTTLHVCLRHRSPKLLNIFNLLHKTDKNHYFKVHWNLWSHWRSKVF
jgi:hypothetical protein